jgi:hypothetical protein
LLIRILATLSSIRDRSLEFDVAERPGDDPAGPRCHADEAEPPFRVRDRERAPLNRDDRPSNRRAHGRVQHDAGHINRSGGWLLCDQRLREKEGERQGLRGA